MASDLHSDSTHSTAESTLPPPLESPIRKNEVQSLGAMAAIERQPSILGIGTATPDFGANFQNGAELAKRLSCDNPKQHRAVELLYRRTKIENRGSVLLDADIADGSINQFYPPAKDADDLGPTTGQRSARYEIEAPRLALEASQRALDQSGLLPEEITHVVTVSCTGFAAPGFDIALIDGLELSPMTQRIQVGFMGCHGAVNGLRAAQGLAAANPGANVLLSSVELCSLHYQYGFDTDSIVSGALFADGAASVVLSSDLDHDDPHSLHTINADGQAARPRLFATGSCLVPNTRDAITWRIGDHGYEMHLCSRVPSLIESELRGFLESFLAEHGESVDSIGGWAVHPGGPRILSAVQNTMGLSDEDMETSRRILRTRGNMSSATMLFIINDFAKQQKPAPWLMLGFGPGLEIEVALIK